MPLLLALLRLDGLGRVDEEVEDDLVDLSAHSSDGREIAEIELDLGDVLYLVARHDECALDALVEVVGAHDVLGLGSRKAL